MPSPEPHTAKPLSIGLRLLLLLLVLALNVGTIFIVAKIWPLPKGQGLAYVAHPIWALGGCVIGAIVYGLMAFRAPIRPWRGLLIGWAVSAVLSYLVFTAL